MSAIDQVEVDPSLWGSGEIKLKITKNVWCANSLVCPAVADDGKSSLSSGLATASLK